MNSDNKIIKKDDRPYIMWERVWLNEFMTLDTCDQKVLAVLYWDELTDEQKQVFSDAEYMEHERYNIKRKQEIMQDPTKMRQHFLEGAAPILDDMIKFAIGTKKPSSTDDQWARSEVWEVLKGIISSASDPAPLIDLKGKDITEQIDEVLTQLTQQRITIGDAKELMSLISSGFNLQQLPELMRKLEMLEGS